jgi:CHAT domain-containing protein
MRGLVFRACVIVVGVAAGLAGCRAPAPPEPVLTERCEPISGSAPVRFDVVSHASGTLNIHIEQRGVSTVAQASGLARPGEVASAQSPIDRFGAVTFVGRADAGRRVAVELRSRDSPGVVGEVCFSAQRLRETDARRLTAEQAFAAGGIAFHASHYDAAFAAFLDAARRFDGIDRRRAAESRHAMAEVAYWRLARPHDAYVLAGWALADFGSQADPALRSTLLLLEAELLLDPVAAFPSPRARASALALESQRLAEQSRFGAREVPRLDTLRGYMEFQQDRPSEANRYFEKAAGECERLEDWECFARARQNLATLAEEARDVPVALEAYLDAARRLPDGLNRQLSADIKGNLGRLQGQAGLFRDSEQSHRESIHLYASIGDCDGARLGLARLGTLLVQVGSIAEGRAYLTRAASVDCRSLLEQIANETIDTAAPARGVAENRSALGCSGLLPAPALTSYAKLAVFNALLGLRDAARLESSEPEAMPCLDAAEPYAFAPRMQLRLANAEGTAALQRNDARRARAEFESGLAVADRAKLPPNHENRSLAYLGLARASLLSNRLDEARLHASRALVQSSARADVAQIVDSLQLMAQSQPAKLGDSAAESILGTAAHLIEQVPIGNLDAEKRATWLATQHAVFADLTHRFADVPASGANESRLWQAFETSERGRSRSLRYAVTQGTGSAAKPDEDATSDRYHSLLAQVVALGSAKAEESPHTIVESLARIASEDGETSQLAGTRAVLQQRLTALNASAVEYAAGRDDMLAFVLDGGTISVVRLGSLRDIELATSALYERLRNPEAAPQDIRKAAARVAALVWWPLAGRVTHPRVLIIPDDALHTVPFAVLPWASAEDSPTLLERAEVSVLPSMLFVTTEHARPPQTNAARFELIGDPVFRAGDWQRECAPLSAGPERAAPARERGVASMMLPRLPGSRAEVLAIQELARRSRPAAHVGLRLGCAATPEGLRAAAAAAPALLHIATHGYVDAYRPRLSALALTPEGSVQGGAAWFDLLDILDTKVDTRLVVLSACDTSRGRLLAGEGVLGPAQAFLQAGAASVIASYWRIADADTAPFMSSFYRYLLAEHRTVADALRRTQLELAKNTSPHVWAAFTLYGWPDTAL